MSSIGEQEYRSSHIWLNDDFLLHHLRDGRLIGIGSVFSSRFLMLAALYHLSECLVQVVSKGEPEHLSAFLDSLFEVILFIQSTAIGLIVDAEFLAEVLQLRSSVFDETMLAYLFLRSLK